MNLSEAMMHAQQNTQIIRARKNLLYTFGSTRLPYVCISECPKNPNDMIVRKGEVLAEKPKIAVPGQGFSFEGFEFDESEKNTQDELAHFFLARRINMPAAKYSNKSLSEEREHGSLEASVEKAVNTVDRNNDIRTGIITTPENVWTLGILIYITTQIIRSAPSNLAEHMERLDLNNNPGSPGGLFP